MQLLNQNNVKSKTSCLQTIQLNILHFMLEIFGTDGHIVIEGKQCPQNFNFDIIFFFKEECGGGANKLVSNIITHRKH